MEDKRKAIVIVESKPSMAIWRKSVSSFCEDLRASNCFSSVSLVNLRCVNDQYVLLQEGIDLTGTYVFFITDGVSRGWDGYAIPKLLCLWAKTCVVSILHVLPENLWYSTRCNGTHGYFATPFAGTTNIELLADNVWRDMMKIEGERDDAPACCFPMSQFTHDSADRWIEMMIRGGQEGHAIYLYEEEPLVGLNSEVLETPLSESLSMPSAEDVIKRFQYLESHSAFELAVFASAVHGPLSATFMDALLQEFIERPNTHHISEFLLGGLLKCDNPEEGNPDSLQFSFLREDVRELLSREVRKGEFQRILDFLRSFPDVSVDPKMFDYWPNHSFQVSLVSG